MDTNDLELCSLLDEVEAKAKHPTDDIESLYRNMSDLRPDGNP